MSEAQALQLNDLASDLRYLRDHKGIPFQRIAEKTGVNRSTISQFANNGVLMKKAQIEALQAFVENSQNLESDASDEQGAQPAPSYKTSIELYETSEFAEAIGWCALVKESRKMGVMIGNPGTGKTTTVKAFARRTDGVHYIEAWPGMRMNDLLSAIAVAAGAEISGNTYRKAQQLVAALKDRNDVMLVIDEAEHLRKWDVEKFEVLRKLWDNTGTPIILCGTCELKAMLTRGSGRENLAQLYRRKIEIKLSGIKTREVKDLLRDYNVTPEAADALARLATDDKHGSMGMFVEALELCLKGAQMNGGKIDADVFKSAMKYKLTY